MQEFYIANNGEAFGPVNVEETNRLWQEGRFENSTLVWDEDSSSWIAAISHPVLSRVVRGEISDENVFSASDPRYADRDELREEMDQLRASIDKLKSDRDRLNAEVSSAAAAAEAVREGQSADEAAQRQLLSNVEKAAENYRAELAAIEKQIEEKIAAGEELARTRTIRIDALNNEIKELEDRSSRLAKQVGAEESAFEKRNAKLLEERDLLVNEVARHTSLHREAEQEAGECQEELSRLAGLIGERRTEFNSLTSRVARVRAENELLDARRIELGREQERLGAVVESIRNELAGMAEEKTELDRLRKEKAETSLRLQELRSALETAASSRDAALSERATLETRVVDLRAECEEIESRTSEARALLGTGVMSSFERIRKTLTDFQDLTVKWKSHHAADAEVQSEKAAALTDALDRVGRREGELVAFLAKLDELARVDSRCAEARAALIDTERRLERERVALEELSRLVADEKKTLGTVKAEKETVAAEMSAMAGERDELAATRDAVFCEVDLARLELSDAKGECRKVDGEIRALRHEREIHEKSVEQIKRSRDGVIDSYRKVEAELSEVSLRLGRAREECAEAVDRQKTLRSQVNEASAEAARLAAECKSIEEQRGAFQEENSKLVNCLEQLAVVRSDFDQAVIERDSLSVELSSAASRAESLKQENELLEKRNAMLVERSESLRQVIADQEYEEEQCRLRQETADAAASEAEQELASRSSEVETLRAAVESIRATYWEAKASKDECDAECVRLQQEQSLLQNSLDVLTKRNKADGDLAEQLSAEIDAKSADLGKLRVDKDEVATQLARCRDELSSAMEEKREFEADSSWMNERLGEIRSELTEAEKERALRARADLSDIRELLRVKEIAEKGKLQRLREKYKAEFKQLQDDWLQEENLGTTGPEFSKIRAEVEEQRHEVSKAERQLAAMRAGLSRLREENGRMLVKRMKSFEAQDLTELRRRLEDARAETAAIKMEWDREVRGAEHLERQWQPSTVAGPKDPQ